MRVSVVNTRFANSIDTAVRTRFGHCSAQPSDYQAYFFFNGGVNNHTVTRSRHLVQFDGCLFQVPARCLRAKSKLFRLLERVVGVLAD